MSEIVFATVEDVNARRSEALITDGEIAHAQALLDDAQAILEAYIKAAGKTVAHVYAKRQKALKAVTCAMVNRAYTTDDARGITSESETIGPVTQNFAYANPNGDLYVTDKEKRLLGIYTGAKIGTIAPNIRG